MPNNNKALLDHNTGVSNGIKKFFNRKPYQESQKQCLIKVPI